MGERAFRPWITIGLVAVNAIAFAISLSKGVGILSVDPERLIALGGSVPALTLSGEPWRLVTAMFLHAGVLHLALNMVALFVGGRVVERLLGRPSFLAIYLVSGLVGGIATLSRTAMIVTVGASGAVFGVFGALFAYLVAHRARLDPEVRARQMKSMGTFLGLNLVIGISVPGISLAAHIGGFVAGGVIAYLGELGLGARSPDEARRRRLPRVLLACLLGVGAVVAGLVLLPKSPVAYVTKAEANQASAFQAAFEKFVASETQLVDQQNATVQRAENGEITRPEAARIFREELVPRWRWIQAELARPVLPAPLVPRQRALSEYIDARVAHLEAVVALLGLDPADPSAAVMLTTVTAKESAVAAALEKVKTAFAAAR